MNKERGTKIGLIGTGFVARGVNLAFGTREDLKVTKVLSRRNLSTVQGFPEEALTNSISEVIDNSEVIIECTGDPIHATEVIYQSLNAGVPVITMDCETQIVSGSYLSLMGYLTEAEGDQPGCLAALKEEALMMGFKPWVYGNMKGYLNHNPTLSDMEYWSSRNRISLPQTIAFTDGTKLQIEQVLVANGLGADILQKGLVGLKEDDLWGGANKLAMMASKNGAPISDYLLSSKLSAGVFIAAEQIAPDKECLKYLKMGEGPFYTLVKPYHLVYFEVEKTLRRVLRGESVLLNNGKEPIASVACISKRALQKGETILRATGSFDARGEAIKIKECPDHVPIGLLQDATVTRDIREGEIIRFDDIEIPETLALKAWQETVKKIKMP